MWILGCFINLIFCTVVGNFLCYRRRTRSPEYNAESYFLRFPLNARVRKPNPSLFEGLFSIRFLVSVSIHFLREAVSSFLDLECFAFAFVFVSKKVHLSWFCLKSLANFVCFTRAKEIEVEICWGKKRERREKYLCLERFDHDSYFVKFILHVFMWNWFSHLVFSGLWIRLFCLLSIFSWECCLVVA